MVRRKSRSFFSISESLPRKIDQGRGRCPVSWGSSVRKQKETTDRLIRTADRRKRSAKLFEKAIREARMMPTRMPDPIPAMEPPACPTPNQTGTEGGMHALGHEVQPAHACHPVREVEREVQDEERDGGGSGTRLGEVERHGRQQEGEPPAQDRPAPAPRASWPRAANRFAAKSWGSSQPPMAMVDASPMSGAEPVIWATKGRHHRGLTGERRPGAEEDEVSRKRQEVAPLIGWHRAPPYGPHGPPPSESKRLLRLSRFPAIGSRRGSPSALSDRPPRTRPPSTDRRPPPPGGRSRRGARGTCRRNPDNRRTPGWCTPFSPVHPPDTAWPRATCRPPPAPLRPGHLAALHRVPSGDVVTAGQVSHRAVGKLEVEGCRRPDSAPRRLHRKDCTCVMSPQK